MQEPFRQIPAMLNTISGKQGALVSYAQDLEMLPRHLHMYL